MSEKIRIGVIGTSWYTTILLSMLAACEDAEVAAICGRTRSRADAVADEHRIAQVFTDYNEMIGHGGLDAVVVASPDDLHHPMTMAALKAGLHVLCEKPMASTVEQARQMFETAEEVGVKHMIEFTWRWMPHYQYLHGLVAGGYVGRGYHYHYRYYGSAARTTEYKWHLDERRANGALGYLGSHMVDMALWLNGDISSVSGHMASFTKRIAPDGVAVAPASESALLALEFADGAQGMIHASTVAHIASRGSEHYVTLHGAEGTLGLEWYREGGAATGVIRGSRQGATEYETLAIPDDYLHGIDASDVTAIFQKHLIGPRLFVDAILRDYQPEPGFDVGLKVQKVLNAAMESHQTGQRVYIGQ